MRMTTSKENQGSVSVWRKIMMMLWMVSSQDQSLRELVICRSLLSRYKGRRYSARQLSEVVEKLMPGCNDENANIVTWSLLALASCASLRISTDQILSQRWMAVWQLGSRSMGSAPTCRSACHLLTIMLQLHLAAQVSVTEMIQDLTTSMEMSGPSVVADSVLHLLRILLKTSQQVSPGKTSVFAEATLAWLCRRYAATLFEDRSYTAVYHQSRPDDVAQLVSSCLGRRPGHSEVEPIALWNGIAQALIVCKEQQSLISYLLLLSEDIGITHPDLALSPADTTSTASRGRLCCETLILNQLIPELHKTVGAWNQFKSERPRGASIEMFGYLWHFCCAWTFVAYNGTFCDIRRQSQMQRQLDMLLGSVSEYAGSSQCPQTLVDAMLVLVSSHASPHRPARTGSYSPSASEHLIYRHISSALTTRRHTTDFGGAGDEDDF